MKKILFICSENSARSQIAEAIVNTKNNGNYVAFSGGTNPAKELGMFTKEVLNELQVDISEYMPKSIEQFFNEEFDFVITLCEKAKNQCPPLSKDAIYVHWDISDPKLFTGNDEEIKKQYGKILRELSFRISLLMALPLESMSKKDIGKKLNEIIFIDTMK